jgi:hypothetical protein
VWLGIIVTVVVSSIGVAVAATWYATARIWLLPQRKIHQMADLLLQEHGANQAKAIATRLSVEAWYRYDFIDWGRWERVVALLDKNTGQVRSK